MKNYLKRGLVKVAPQVYAKWRWPLESKLVRGEEVQELQNRPSVLFFTTHKCASTLMPGILEYLNHKYLGLLTANIEAMIWSTREGNVPRQICEHKDRIFRSTGVLYGPLRQYIPVSDTSDYDVLLMLRDPRDVLVSHYFSLAYSHSPPLPQGKRKSFLESRARIQAQSIDEYCLENAPRYLKVYDGYLENLVLAGACSLLRYEDMILHTDRWIDSLGDALSIPLSGADRAKIKEFGQFDKGMETEDHLKHVRQRLPGDHRKKLLPETCERLNAKFSKILGALSYAE